MAGRPTEFTQEIADAICEALEQGVPVAETCRKLGIGRTTVYDWQKGDPAFSERFAHARDAGGDAIAERARLTARGKTEEEGGDSTGDTQRDKLIVETDLKLLAKWNPKRYGDRVAVDHGGEVNVKHDIAAGETAARLAAILEAARRRMEQTNDDD